MNIVILGPPGSGKSTQAKLLSNYLNSAHMSVGRKLREISSNSTHPLQERVENEMATGELVDDEIVNKILDEFVEKEVDEKGFILDGAPRKKRQMHVIDEVLKKHDEKVDLAIFIDTSLKESKERLMERSKEEDREDDNPEAIEKRFNVYLKSTLPVLKEYKRRGILNKVDGDKTINDIHKSIVNVIEDKNGNTKAT